VGDREWEQPSTPIRGASAVTKQRKSDGTVGGGEELEDGAESDIGAGIRYDGQACQGGKPESEGATATGDVENDAEFGPTEEERNGRHAIRPTEGQGTSMHADGPQEGSDGDGRMIRTGGEHEKDDDGESRHGAREEGWETAACGKANDGTGTEPEGKERATVEKSTSENGTTESDETRSGHGMAGRRGTVARTEKRPKEDPPHLFGRRRQLRNNVSPTERWVATRSRRPTRSRVPEWTYGAKMRASRPETTSRSQEGLRRWKTERLTRK
jgi:hypothetical protein